MGTLDPSSLLLTGVGLVLLGLKLWALVDAATRPAAAFVAASKLTKVVWLVILALAVVLGGGGVLGLFGILSAIAAIVYLVDVRPAVRGVQSGGR